MGKIKTEGIGVPQGRSDNNATSLIKIKITYQISRILKLNVFCVNFTIRNNE
jgi:hypothetical protein